MPDEPNGEGQQGDGQESSVIRELREKAKAHDDAVARLAQIERERAFEKAGIDVDSAVGKLLMRGYDGPAEADQIKVFVEETGVLRAEKPAGSEQGNQQQGHEAAQGAPENTGTAERQALAHGSASDEPPELAPQDAAKKAADDIRGRGGTWDDESAAFLGQLVTAANKGDPRVTLDPRTGRRRVDV